MSSQEQPLTLQCPPALSPLLLLSSTLPFTPQVQSSHSGPFTVPAPLPEMCLPAPFISSTSQVKIQPMLQGSVSLSLLHIPLPQACTQNQFACHHQPIPCAFTRKMRRQHVKGRTSPKSPYSTTYWLSHFGKITLSLRASVLYL